MKTIISSLVILMMTASVYAQDNQNQKRRPPRGPQLTDEQRSCLESQMGGSQDGQRPSRDAMEAAFEYCDIEMPPRPSKGDFRKQKNSDGGTY